MLRHFRRASTRVEGKEDQIDIEATRRLTEAHPDTRVVLIGAAASRERVDRVLESGGRGYVLLETPPWELAGMLLGLFRGGNPKLA